MSLKAKELQASELFDDHGLDILGLTETWLTNKETDKNWCEATNLNKGNTLLHTHIHTGRGGGVGLIWKSHYKVSVLRKGHKSAFEYCTWELTVKRLHLTVTGIYQPPHSNKNKITNKMFIDDVIEFMTTLLRENSNNIIIGDFNLHISNDEDADATIFMDTCEAFGLYQYITFSTHKSGNILDLLLTQVASDARVLRTHRGRFICNHTAVIAQLNVKKFTGTRESKLVRVVKGVMADQWILEFENQDLQLSDSW